ncbi:MAG TPA: ABC transporter permease [Prolixibacteraceae bacterium]|nr:ABC transporter permease [Prolixibacteraceae bacterium]HRV89618.1 ABC transporter permease [Prolixibacteraceae bacterium]
MLWLRVIYESFSSAVNSLKVNKLRTLLSLLGITIGIFAIISVFTVIDSLERYIRNSLQSLGSNMVYVAKWPWTPPEGETEYPWWKYLNRPVPTPEEAEEILRKSRQAGNAVFFYGFNRAVEYGAVHLSNVEVMPTTYPLAEVWNLKVERGRYFTVQEMHAAVPVALIGHEIAEQLFGELSPLEKEIRIQGIRFRVIGVYARTGQDMFGTSMDKRIHLSLNGAQGMGDFRHRDQGQTICITGRPGADQEELTAEIRAILRSSRRLKPMDENNFAINEVNLISTQFDAFFKVFNMAGWIIGGFSILVGGFGIANIMFVSVKERTRIIGIQKSLGAKRIFILLEFIFEAVILSVIGGLAGLVLIFAGTLVFNYVSDMSVVLTLGNILLGLTISGVIGFLAGMLPASAAARLDPVVAINAL